MKSTYKLLVHYSAVHRPSDVARSLLREWERSQRTSLRLHDDQGRNCSADNLDAILSFGAETESVSVSFRSCQPNSQDVVELFFTNPTWNYSAPTNSCAVY